jgi:hypothetical protein
MTPPNNPLKFAPNIMTIFLLAITVLTAAAQCRSPTRILEEDSDIGFKKPDASMHDLIKNSTCGKYCKMCDTVTMQCKFCTRHTYLAEGKGCVPVEENERVHSCENYSNRGICISCEFGHYYQLGECKKCKDRDRNVVDCRLSLDFGVIF